MSEFSQSHQPSDSPKPEPSKGDTVLRVSLEVLQERFIPAEVTFQAISVDDAAAVLEQLLIDENGHYSIETETLAGLIAQCRDGAAFNREALFELAPIDDSLAIRRVTHYSISNGAPHEQRELEIERLRNLEWAGPLITIMPRLSNDTFAMRVSWGRTLAHHSPASIDYSWEDVENVIRAVKGNDLDVLPLTRTPGAPNVIAVGSQITLAVVERDQFRASPFDNQHLSVDPYFIEVCALRPPPSVDQDKSLNWRFDALQGKIADLENVFPNLKKDSLQEFEASRSMLKEIGDNLVLNAGEVFHIMCVEGYLLLVTRSSTGNSLLADLEELVVFERQYSISDKHPLPPVKEILASDPSAAQLQALLQVFSFPASEAFMDTVLDFARGTATLNFSAAQACLLSERVTGSDATLTTREEYRLSMRYPSDDEGDMDEMDDMEDGTPTLVLFRNATVTAPREDPSQAVPSIGFYPESSQQQFIADAYAHDMEHPMTADVFVKIASTPLFWESSSPSILSRRLAGKALTALGIDLAALRPELASEPGDPRAVNLSETVRVLY